jgi:hypothetical protein
MYSEPPTAKADELFQARYVVVVVVGFTHALELTSMNVTVAGTN